MGGWWVGEKGDRMCPWLLARSTSNDGVCGLAKQHFQVESECGKAHRLDVDAEGRTT